MLAFAPEITKWYNEVLSSGKAASEAELGISAMNEALGSTEYTDAVKQIGELTVNTDLAKQGFMDKAEVLEQYNSTVGQTMGQLSTLQELEEKLTKSGPAYIKLTMLKASAQIALQNSAKKAFEAEQLKLKGYTESANFTDKVKAGFNR